MCACTRQTPRRRLRHSCVLHAAHGLLRHAMPTACRDTSPEVDMHTCACTDVHIGPYSEGLRTRCHRAHTRSMRCAVRCTHAHRHTRQTRQPHAGRTWQQCYCVAPATSHAAAYSNQRCFGIVADTHRHTHTQHAYTQHIQQHLTCMVC